MPKRGAKKTTMYAGAAPKSRRRRAETEVELETSAEPEVQRLESGGRLLSEEEISNASLAELRSVAATRGYSLARMGGAATRRRFTELQAQDKPTEAAPAEEPAEAVA